MAESRAEEFKRNGKQYLLQLRKSTDADIIEKLDSQENKNGYLKALIRADLEDSDSVEFKNPDTLSSREKRIVLRYISNLIDKDIKEEEEEK